MSTVKFDQWLNSDGSENYKCRAWVRFNGSGTVAIDASQNVTSITDNAVGDYTVNLTTAMPDVNYATAVSTDYLFARVYPDLSTTTTIRLQAARQTDFNGSTALYDATNISIVCFR